MSQDTNGHTPARAPIPLWQASASEAQLRDSAAADPANFAAWWQLGLLALGQGRHQQAIADLQKAADLRPDDATVHHHLGIASLALGDAEQAARHYHRAVCLKPDHADGHNNWGIALAQQGRPQEACDAFAHALRLNPSLHEAHKNWGTALFNQGRLDEAAEHFRAALAIHPAYPDGLTHLGTTLARLGQREEALACFDEALRLRPAHADAHHQRGTLCRDLGRHDDAVASFRAAIKLRPAHPADRPHLAQALARQGKADEALACLHEGLLFRPEDPDAYANLGLLLSQANRLDESAAAFSQVVRLRPEGAEGHNNLGNVLLRQHKAADAVRCFQRALELRGDYAQPHCNLGSALMMQNKAAEAVGPYREAIRLQPDYVDAHFNLGNALRALNRHDEAVPCYQRVLELQPENGGALFNLAATLSEKGQLDEAVAMLEGLLKRKPDLAAAHNTLGVVRLHQGRPADALAHFDDGLRLCPDDPEIHLNRSLVWLGTGDFQRGWPEYEWRWKLKKVGPGPHVQPLWDGSPLPNGTIVLWAEQGIGDTLQFARYAALVKERVGTVLLDCFGPVRGLLAGCPGIDGLLTPGEGQPRPDVQAPLLSLPRIFNTTADTIPAPGPYLFPDANLRDRWREKMGAARELKVGLVWQGNPQFSGDRHRSVKLSRFRPLAEVPGVRLFSLQKNAGSEQLADLTDAMPITDLGSQLSGDFRDTAAALVSLDLLISVDTAVAHLAGALGVPVWILIPFAPDWRWLREGETTPWYPSARLFRQQKWGDWDGVLDRVAEALREKALRPLPQRIAVPLPLPELVEMAVRAEVAQAPADELWAALAQAGVPDTADFARHAAALKRALQEVRDAEAALRSLDGAPDVVRRLLDAHQSRDAARASLTAWLSPN